jgi:hypothetical protein
MLHTTKVHGHPQDRYSWKHDKTAIFLLEFDIKENVIGPNYIPDTLIKKNILEMTSTWLMLYIDKY